MKTDPRRFAPLGLVVSALAILSLAGFILTRALAAANIFQPPDPQLLDRGIWISVSCIFLGLAVTAVLDPEKTRQFLMGRQMKYGSNAIIMLVAFLAILFFLNLLAFQNKKTWDVTESKANTLAPETIRMLAALPSPVSARAYFTTSADKSAATKLLDNLKQAGNGKFSYQFIDPNSNPVAAQQDGITRDSTIVLEMAGHKEQVNSSAEQDVDTSIMRLINPETRVIYFLTGHGEADTQQAGNTSYTAVVQTLTNKNYTVKTLNLGSTGSIPKDAKTVVVGGPQQPLSTSEVAALETYLNNGGSLIVMEDPRSLTKFGDAPDPLADLLTKWGITYQNDIVVDPQANPPLLAYSDTGNYGQHPITAQLRGVNSRFFTTQSIKLETAPQGVTLTALAQTYPEAWGETDFSSIKNNTVSFDKATDLAGPLVLAAAAENPATKSRLVVFGDWEFASDALYQQGNGDIFVNALDWTANQEQLISLTPKPITNRTYNPPGTLGFISIVLTSICIIPLLVIAGGVAAWFSRRRRG